MLIDAYYKYLKERTTGFGRHMEQVSIDNMKGFAAAMDFAFYRSKPTNASVLLRQRPSI